MDLIFQPLGHANTDSQRWMCLANRVSGKRGNENSGNENEKRKVVSMRRIGCHMFIGSERVAIVLDLVRLVLQPV